MKKLVTLFSFLFIFTILMAQNTIYQYRILNPVGGAKATGNTGFIHTAGLPATYASITWTTSGTLASCTVQVDYSNDGSTVAGQLVPAQTCTGSGTIIEGGTSTPAYTRVSYVIGTGGGSINFVAYGCNNSTCTNGGGGGGSGTLTNLATGTGLTGGPITTTGTVSLVTPVAVANGGTGTATPSLIAGANVTITGSFPNQTVAAVGGGTVGGSLTQCQRVSATNSTTLTGSGPIYDTSTCTGASFVARVAACLSLVSTNGGVCDATAEGTSAVASSVSMTGNGVSLILPPVALTFGSGAGVTVSGNNNTVKCGGGYQKCIFNIYGSAGTDAFTVSGNNNDISGIQFYGGRCGPALCTGSPGSGVNQTEKAFTVTGNGNKIHDNLLVDIGYHGVFVSNSSFNKIYNNTINRSGKEGILVNGSSATLKVQNNEIYGNYLNDDNTLQVSDGSISASCSAPCVSPNVDGTDIHDNTVRFLVYNTAFTCATGGSGLTYTTSDTGCREGIQSTDTAWGTKEHDNAVYNSENEGYTNSGMNGSENNNTCDACGIGFPSPTFGAGCYMFQRTNGAGTFGNFSMSGNKCSNTSAIESGYCYSIQDPNASSVGVTYENIVVSGNSCTGQNGGVGWNVGYRFARTSITDNLTIQNVIFAGNTAGDTIGTPYLVSYGSGGSVTGVVRAYANNFNNSTDTAPVAGDIVIFSNNLQPQGDSGTLASSILTNPMTHLGDIIDGGVSGTPTRIPGATSPNGVPQFFTSTPSGGVATAVALSLPGVSGRAVTGTTSTDTIVSTDCSPNRVEYVGSVAVAVTLPTATSLSVPNCYFKLVNKTTGSATALTVTPTTWTINGSATLTIAQNQVAYITVDPNSATNWQADIAESGLTAGSNITITRASGTTTVASSGGASGISGATNNGLAYATGATTATSTGAATNGQVLIGSTGNPPVAATITGGTAITSTAGAGSITIGVTAGAITHTQTDSTFPTLVATGTSAMGTGGITTGTCATVVTTTATGAATTDTILFTPSTDPTAITGYSPSASGSLYIWAYPTSGNVNFRVCNNTSGTITPSALTLNWKVLR